MDVRKTARSKPPATSSAIETGTRTSSQSTLGFSGRPATGWSLALVARGGREA
jgi:hypothetical protein